MSNTGTKDAAEAVLRELPSVVGAFVREDIHGHPREIHLLIRPGPRPRDLARDVRELLEERLGIPVDQRVISIAQLSGEAAEAWNGETTRMLRIEHSSRAPDPVPPDLGESARPGRLRFTGAEATVSAGRVTIRVHVDLEGAEYVGHCVEPLAGGGRIRAAAAATLDAAGRASPPIRLELEAASIVRALERDYAIVSALASAPPLGRRPLRLVGAHPVEDDADTAAALAALKALNRTVARLLPAGTSAV